MAAQETIRHSEPAKASFYNDPKVRGLFYQFIVVAALVLFGYWIVHNTVDNLRRANIASGFGFLNTRSGFDIGQSVIAYTSDSLNSRALLVGFLNTLLIAVSGIVTASIVGLLVGIGRLSRNWLIRKICMVYVEVFRNIPPLLVIFFWYIGVLAVLPQPRESYHLPFGSFLNSRGFFLPKFIWGDGSWLILVGILVGIGLSWFVARQASARQMATGQTFPVFWTSVGLIVGLPLLAFAINGFPLTTEFPKQSTFNLTGGFQVKPEFLALFMALSFYTASFIAEIVRAGIIGVNKGQTEASLALGLRPGTTLRLVVVPQAMRIIIPPLASQYLNLTKNSSLAIAIGYPDLYATAGTISNQTGQAVEIIIILLVVYLGISLLTSLFMNWFNAKMALAER